MFWGQMGVEGPGLGTLRENKRKVWSTGLSMGAEMHSRSTVSLQARVQHDIRQHRAVTAASGLLSRDDARP